ncbi:MAG: phosphate ABC transporter permease PstA [Acidimicrobiia bacterium]|nr:phosphate ABC transporter permease PstA [Acidimicrobiia bacterium]
MTDTTTATKPDGGPAGPTRRPLSEKTPNAKRRETIDRAVSIALAAALAVAIIPLLLIVWQVLVKGFQAINLEFFTEVEPLSYRASGGGYVHGLIGTLYMVGLAALMSVPLGVITALYLVEYGKGRFAAAVRFFTDVMTGIPSIFVGLFVYALLVQPYFGFGTLMGGIALAILMLPIVVRSSEEILKLVPTELRENSYALGARHWQTVFKVVLPAALPGVATGCMLAVARAAGETAPIILTAFGARQITLALQDGTGQAALPMLIYRGASQPFPGGIERAWGGALLLIGLVLILTILARFIASKSRVTPGGIS